MKKITIFLVFLLFVCSKFASAQTTLPQQTSVFTPKVLMDKVLDENKIKTLSAANSWGQKINVSDKKSWIVYSDRNDNNTYQKPSASSGKYKTLSFNEQVRIAQISNDFALVYKDPRNQYPYISSEAECMGWIPMSNLLLWSSCPANSKGIYNKALLVVNLDNANSTDNTYNSHFFTPNTSSRAMKNQSGMEFFFIMKEENGMALLSHQHSLDEGATTQTLYGWVSQHAYISWNQRSCLEPNWDTDDVPRLSSVSVKAKNGLTNTYQFGHIWTKDTHDEDRFRIPASMFRYPILDNDTKDNSQYKCTTFGTGANSGGQDLTDAIERWRKALEKQETTLNRMQNLNLIVVIDGTKSMDPYFESVKNAIIKGCEYFSDNYRPKVGIVVYRDYTCSTGLVETMKMTNANDPAWKNFLDANAKKCSQEKNDPDQEEALYFGLNTALDTQLMGYRKDESNLMLVVGDCGNHLNDKDKRCPKEEELVQKMTENGIHLMSFQVRRNNAQPWILYNRQMTQLLRKSIQARYDALRQNIKVQFAEVSNGYDLKREDGGDKMFFVGATRYAMQGTEMSPAELTNLMAKNFRTFGNAVQAQIDLVAQLRNGSPVQTEEEEKRTATEELNKALLIQLLGESAYNDIVSMNKMLAYTGYTPKTNSSGTEYWKPVLFISRSEFQSLLDRLSDVDESAKSGDRLPLINAIKALVKSMLPGVSDKEMDQKGLGEVMALIAGLNAATKTMTSDRTLADLGDPKVVSAAEFNKIVTDFQRKYKNLRDILTDRNYRFICNINQVKYYWIPVEELP